MLIMMKIIFICSFALGGFARAAEFGDLRNIKASDIMRLFPAAHKTAPAPAKVRDEAVPDGITPSGTGIRCVKNGWDLDIVTGEMSIPLTSPSLFGSSYALFRGGKLAATGIWRDHSEGYSQALRAYCWMLGDTKAGTAVIFCSEQLKSPEPGQWWGKASVRIATPHGTFADPEVKCRIDL